MTTRLLGHLVAGGLLLWSAGAGAQFGSGSSGFGGGGSGLGSKTEAKPMEPPALFNPQVDQLYRQAVLLFRSRRYDEAEALCQRVLSIKPNELNTVNLMREIAEMRARVPAYDPGAAMKRRLQETVIKHFTAVEVPVRDLVAPLQKASAEGTPDKVPLNFVWCMPAGETIPTVGFEVKNTPIADVLGYLTYRNGLGIRVDENAVVIGKGLAPAMMEVGPMSALKQKLRETILPEVRIEEAKVLDAISLLQSLSIKHAADKSSFNTVWQVPKIQELPTVTVSLYRVSLGDALRYVTEVSGLRYQVDERAIVIYPAPSPPTDASSTPPK